MTPPTGRYAPTPSGPLHFGSVVAAVGSYLSARAAGGRWLLRIDDLDGPRVAADAADEILRTLAALALNWDGAVVYQSTRSEAYREALAELGRRAHLFGCRCTRSQLGSGAYPGTCRARSPQPGLAWRIEVNSQLITIADGLQGHYRECLAETVGDFVVQRADGIAAYHLAVVVDDAWSGVDSVVRGADLLASTPRQVYLQQALGLPTPAYLHLPVVVDASGEKLSKQTHAPPVRPEHAADALFHALCFLGLNPPMEALGETPATLLQWALPKWSTVNLDPRARTYRWRPDGIAGSA